MKKIYLLATVVAIITGITVYLFASSLQAKNQNTAVVYDMVNVVAAAVDIPANTKLTPEMLVLVEIPKEAVAPESVLDKNQLEGRTTKYPLSKGELFMSYKTAEIGDIENESLSDRIKEGYRAFTIHTDEVGGVAGYLKIGDRVDIIVTKQIPVENESSAGEDTEELTELGSFYLLQDIPIIALGSASQYVTGQEELKTYSNITLEVSADVCTMLNYNMTNGFIKLVLRGYGDGEIADISVYPEH